MKTNRKFANIILILTGIIFFVLEAVTASRWVNPTYSYKLNWVSDLGIPAGVNQVSSPFYGLMNFNFILFGVMLMIGYYFMSEMLDTKARRRGIILVLLTALGAFLYQHFPATNGKDRCSMR